MFASALANVRRCGGVLEHPAYSDAWKAFDLPRPDRHGGWIQGACGGWSCHVEQGRYGHVAKKATWLYWFSPAGALPPDDLLWGSDLDTQSRSLVSWCGNHVASGETRPRVGKRAAAATPPAFKELLARLALHAAHGPG